MELGKGLEHKCDGEAPDPPPLLCVGVPWQAVRMSPQPPNAVPSLPALLLAGPCVVLPGAVRVGSGFGALGDVSQAKGTLCGGDRG